MSEGFRGGDLVQTKAEPRQTYKILYVQRDRARCRLVNPDYLSRPQRPVYLPLTALLPHPRTL